MIAGRTICAPSLRWRDDGRLGASPMPKQDSSMQALFVAAGCLIKRVPHAPAAAAGTAVTVLPLAPDPIGV